MLRILKFLVTGNWHACSHEWVTKDEGNIVSEKDETIVRGAYKNCCCKKCGEWKNFELRGGSSW